MSSLDELPCRDRMNLEFSGELWFWKGPAPWHFITVPDEHCGALEVASRSVSYGEGLELGDTVTVRLSVAV